MAQAMTQTYCDILIFGGLSDLAMRKLIPALFHLQREKLLPDGRIIGISRRQISREDYIAHCKQSIETHVASDYCQAEAWDALANKLDYLPLDVNNSEAYESIKGRLTGSNSQSLNLIIYLALPPNLFELACAHLGAVGLSKGNSRIVLEKPIGSDLASCRSINQTIAKYFSESQTFRIDHYLGKEAVQNLLALRFANVLFEPIWNRKGIDSVQITAAESVGAEGRLDYYDKFGALRDMVQNHLLQTLCLIAMEPPHTLDDDAVRDEKIKVLKSLRPLTGAEAVRNSVRGQYGAGYVEGQAVGAYGDMFPDHVISDAETFVALRVDIDNWRWADVPFYLRTGKRLPKQYTEITIDFKPLPHSIFAANRQNIKNNRLVIRLQPEEGIKLSLMNKVPGLTEKVMELRALPLNLSFSEVFDKKRTVGAYERLLLDVLHNNPTLFVRRDEVEAAWDWIDGIVDGWRSAAYRPEEYPAGSWGPVSAVQLIARDGRIWYE